MVPDLRVAISEWAAKGVGPFLTLRSVTPGGYRYEGRSSKPKLDVAFSQQGDLQVELIEMSDLSRRLFALIRREAERWDGNRPSRSLLGAADWGIRWAAVKMQLAALVRQS